jgi:large subunit ribosomal protein L10
MALSKDKKQAVVDDLTALLSDAKIAVIADYTGLTVKEMQELRSTAREQGTTVRVVKNRLTKIALNQTEGFKEADLSSLNGQMVLGVNSQDEVAPAQTFATFAKKHPNLKLVSAVDNSGQVMDQAQVNHLASLPSKDQLRGQLVGTIAAPLTGFVTVMGGNMRGLVNVLNARKSEMA